MDGFKKRDLATIVGGVIIAAALVVAVTYVAIGKGGLALVPAIAMIR